MIDTSELTPSEAKEISDKHQRGEFLVSSRECPECGEDVLLIIQPFLFCPSCDSLLEIAEKDVERLCLGEKDMAERIANTKQPERRLSLLYAAIEGQQTPKNRQKRYVPQVYQPREEHEYQEGGFMNTFDALKKGMVTGAKIAGSQEANKLITKIIRKVTGENYPEFFNTPLGAGVEQFLVPAMLHYLAVTYPNSVPKADDVRRICEYAMIGAGKDAAVIILAVLTPALEQISNLPGQLLQQPEKTGEEAVAPAKEE